MIRVTIESQLLGPVGGEQVRILYDKLIPLFIELIRVTLAQMLPESQEGGAVLPLRRRSGDNRFFGGVFVAISVFIRLIPVVVISEVDTLVLKFLALILRDLEAHVQDLLRGLLIISKELIF